MMMLIAFFLWFWRGLKDRWASWLKLFSKNCLKRFDWIWWFWKFVFQIVWKLVHALRNYGKVKRRILLKLKVSWFFHGLKSQINRKVRAKTTVMFKSRRTLKHSKIWIAFRFKQRWKFWNLIRWGASTMSYFFIAKVR